MRDENWSFAEIALEKDKINPVRREPSHFNPKFAGALLTVAPGSVQSQADRALRAATRHHADPAAARARRAARLGRVCYLPFMIPSLIRTARGEAAGSKSIR